MLKSTIKNKKGMAVIEMIPMMIITAVIINFSLGFFGAIHSGILQSMGARNYAFETLLHRTNYHYFRDTGFDPRTYRKIGSRIHTVTSETKANGKTFYATQRPIQYLVGKYVNIEDKGTVQDHTTEVNNVKPGVQYTDKDGVTTIWVKPVYGICLSAECKPL
ncbi:MAG: hypothetical protein ACK5P5_12240 [Pseudobdellovibrionaceae bacterium]